MDPKLKLSQQCIFSSKDNSILDSIRKNTVYRSGGNDSSSAVLRADEITSGVFCPVLGSQIQEKKGHIQNHRIIKM